MGKKARSKQADKGSKKAEQGEAASKTPAPDAEPLFRGTFAALLWLTIAVAVTGVALWFSLDVNRVFDMPKAVALKVGGCGAFLAWLLYALFGPGTAWRSARVFAAPVFALVAAVALSTAFSIDPWMSLVGVYERQFGLQGYLACAGLFVVGATSLRGKRGALMAMATLIVLGGIISGYAYLQSEGVDPYGFFKKPHNKVYSTLGNATFAGNSLALLFPMSAMIATVASVLSLGKARADGDAGRTERIVSWLIGFALVPFLVLAPTLLGSGDPTAEAGQRQLFFKLGAGLSVVVLVFGAATGSRGWSSVQFESSKGRRIADANLAGGLAGMVALFVLGLLRTRTRGAWVGTGAAIGVGLLLLPVLFDDQKQVARRLRLIGAGSLLTLAIGLGVFIKVYPDHLYARTILSIPYAFNPNATKYGKGQGTRRYLWAESPRVLTGHGYTLARQQIDDTVLANQEPLDPGELHPAGSVLDKILVWPFGIGFETYRYAFMSHKSKRLEALDPMTNHDNPHNNYLYVLATTGLVGLAAYLWVLWRLLITCWRNFYGTPRTVLRKRESEHLPDLANRFSKTSDEVRLFAIPAPEDVASQLDEAMPGHSARVENGVVIVDGDSGPALEYLATVPIRHRRDRTHRAIAFGILTSFFSYTVYSIAGFDSVACSVFLFFLLGSAAVFFEPAPDEEPRPLVVQLRRQFALWRGRDPSQITANQPVVAAVLAVIGFFALGHTVKTISSFYEAEKIFVARGDFDTRIRNMERAIEINPRESYYHQTIGGSYSRAAQQLQGFARRAATQGRDRQQAQGFLVKSSEYAKKAEQAYFAALPHAWAPENIYISLFQLYYGRNDTENAQDALRLALLHSPHLAPVRANLSVIELEQSKAYRRALKDCRWVLDIDPTNGTALRTCGRAATMLGDFSSAKTFLEQAKRRAPNDATVDKYIRELAEARSSTSVN